MSSDAATTGDFSYVYYIIFKNLQVFYLCKKMTHLKESKNN